MSQFAWTVLALTGAIAVSSGILLLIVFAFGCSGLKKGPKIKQDEYWADWL